MDGFAQLLLFLFLFLSLRVVVVVVVLVRFQNSRLFFMANAPRKLTRPTAKSAKFACCENKAKKSKEVPTK